MLILAILAMMHTSTDKFPAGWRTGSPREEIRPRFDYEQTVGPSNTGCFVIKHDNREGLHGWFAKSFDIQGGNCYRFRVVRKTMNVAVPRRSAVARILWRDSAGNAVPMSSAPPKGYLTSFIGTAEAEHPLDGAT